MRSLIGISADEISNHKLAWLPNAYGQTSSYSTAIIRAGGSPVIVPLTNDEHALRDIYSHLDGVLLAGGNDIDPALYRQSIDEQTKDISRLRDEVEAKLLGWAQTDNKPVLAICRGMQLVNVMRSGSLYQHVINSAPNTLDHTISIKSEDINNLTHNLRISPNSHLSKILDTKEILANTLHHQAIDKLGNNLKAVAWAEDGVIEAIEDPEKRYLIGVQCHPELLEDSAEKKWRKLFSAFVDSTV